MLPSGLHKSGFLRGSFFWELQDASKFRQSRVGENCVVTCVKMDLEDRYCVSTKHFKPAH